MWKRFKRDFKERFMNFETAKGIYILPAGLFMMYVSWYEVEYAIRTAGVLIGGYAAYEGIRKIVVNRVKQAIAKKKLLEERENDLAE